LTRADETGQSIKTIEPTDRITIDKRPFAPNGLDAGIVLEACACETTHLLDVTVESRLISGLDFIMNFIR